jgi:hypothetical protein
MSGIILKLTFAVAPTPFISAGDDRQSLRLAWHIAVAASGAIL